MQNGHTEGTDQVKRTPALRAMLVFSKPSEHFGYLTFDRLHRRRRRTTHVMIQALRITRAYSSSHPAMPLPLQINPSLSYVSTPTHSSHLLISSPSSRPPISSPIRPILGLNPNTEKASTASMYNNKSVNPIKIPTCFLSKKSRCS